MTVSDADLRCGGEPMAAMVEAGERAPAPVAPFDRGTLAGKR
jgi:hypothetical protein